MALKADQAVASEILGFVAIIVEHFSKLGILINNAGVFGAGTVHDTHDTSRFERQLRINY